MPCTSERVNFVVNVGVRLRDGPASISIRESSLSFHLSLRLSAALFRSRSSSARAGSLHGSYSPLSGAFPVKYARLDSLDSILFFNA